MKKLVSELIRRSVLRALGAYIAIVWLLTEGVVDIFPALGLPDWSVRAFFVVAVLATPFVAIISWKFDLTFKGLLRDSADVAAARNAPGYVTSGPTRQSPRRTGTGRTVIRASWVDHDGEQCQQEFDSEFVIGRDYQADVRINDDRVSRCHVKVYPEGTDWIVKDLSSLNGSFVNGEPIDARRIETTTEVALDLRGPVIQLAPHVPEDTLLTTRVSEH